jgi:hypothetical protein
MKRIHWPAIILSAVLYMALGMAWYTLWAEPWMRFTGITDAQAEAGPAMLYLLSFIGSIIYSLTLNWLLLRVGAKGFSDGAKFGLIIGMVFCFITVMNENGYMLKPLGLGLINGLYPVLALSLMGGLLAAWRKAPAADLSQARPQN